MHFNNRKNNFQYIIVLMLLLAGCGGGGGGGNSTATPSGINDVKDDVSVVAGSLDSLAGEGTYDTIHSGELAFGGSGQAPEKIIFSVVVPPSGGQLEIASDPGRQISQFTQADIDAGRVVYKHKRGALKSDSFEFIVDDGQGNTLVGEKFFIAVVPNITSPGLEFDNGRVDLSWTVPVSQEFIGVEVRRRGDGGYPDALLSGVLVDKTQSGEQQVTDDVFVDTSKGPQYFYYTVFSYGKNGVYSDGVNVGLYCDFGRCVKVPDLRELNSLSSRDEVGQRRDLLINEIWGVDTLPGWMPASVTPVTDTSFSNAQSIQEILVQMDDGIFSKAWFFRPRSANNGKLVIYHQGHRGGFHQGTDTIQHLLQEGFHVLGVSMPLIGLINQLQDESFIVHDDLAVLDRPMRFFLEPVSVALNYVTSEHDFSAIYMMGISGGGWTTVVYSAIDERIAASYPVAGSYPFYLREQLGGLSIGDFEQTNPDFYQHASYIELYLLSATDRRQLQIFNEFDDCCFEGTYSKTYKSYIQDEARMVGGSFDIVIDDTIVGHQISDFALERIINDMNSSLLSR